MEVVLADGSIATVTEDKVVIHNYDGSGRSRIVSMTEDTDLWFALRGAGSSFAIVTEFLVTVYPEPETLPIIIPITADTVQDISNIESAAASDPSYLISVYSYRRYFDGIFPLNLLPYSFPQSVSSNSLYDRFNHQYFRIQCSAALARL